MNINFKKFRLSSYQEHKVTGMPPIRAVAFASYMSSDHGSSQCNFSLKVGLTTWHFKWRSNAI